MIKATQKTSLIGVSCFFLWNCKVWIRACLCAVVFSRRVMKYYAESTPSLLLFRGRDLVFFQGSVPFGNHYLRLENTFSSLVFFLQSICLTNASFLKCTFGEDKKRFFSTCVEIFSFRCFVLCMNILKFICVFVNFLVCTFWFALQEFYCTFV